MSKPSQVKISAVFSTGINGEIGHRGDLIWRIKEDLAHFKELTTGSPVVMGGLTWKSLPFSLPNRMNVVVSKSMTPHFQNERDEGHEHVVYMRTDKGPAFFSNDLETAIRFASSMVRTLSCRDQDIFIIGGAALLQTCIDRDWIDRFYLTEVQAEFKEADCKLDLNKALKNFKRTEESTIYENHSTEVRWRYATYERKEALEGILKEAVPTDGGS